MCGCRFAAALCMLAANRFLVAVADLCLVPLGLIGALLPTRTCPFCRAWRRLRHPEQKWRLPLTDWGAVAQPPLGPLPTHVALVDRDRLYWLCASNLLFALGDLCFLPLGLASVLVPSRTAPFCVAWVAASTDVRHHDRETSHGMDLPGEFWSICFYK